MSNTMHNIILKTQYPNAQYAQYLTPST